MDEWFDKGNPGPWICRATHPSVAIVAEDDPICVPENFRTVDRADLMWGDVCIFWMPVLVFIDADFASNLY